MPARTEPFNDPNLTIVSIEDFTPGIFTFSRGNYPQVVTPRAPIGSASAIGTYRCYAIANYGLVPFPTYRTLINSSVSLPNGGSESIAAMYPLASNPSGLVPDAIVYATNTVTPGSPPTTGFAVRWIPATSLPSSSTLFYSNSGSNLGSDHLFFAAGVFIPPFSPPTISNPTRSVAIVDPTTGTMTWVTAPAWNGTNTTGTITSPGVWNTTAHVFFVNNRMCFEMISNEALLYSNQQAASGIFSSDLNAMNNFSGPNLFYPEMGIGIGTWGSISDGEFFFVYQGGGGVLVYGDLAFPTSAVKLPGLAGTGNADGPGVETSVGLVYVTDFDGAYVWNGGNTSTKISQAISDDVLFRGSPLPAPFSNTARASAHNDVWSNWVMFANNWMWDVLTGSWWKVEDPAVNTMMMHCPSLVTTGVFYSSDWMAVNNTGSTGPVTVHIFVWDRTIPATTYRWTSNPISPIPGRLFSLEWVEIVATNPTATGSATVTVTPIGDANTLGNNTQHVAFTVPPNVQSWRGSMRLGFSGYNMQIQVDSVGAGSNPAPSIHEIHLGFVPTRTSQVE